MLKTATPFGEIWQLVEYYNLSRWLRPQLETKKPALPLQFFSTTLKNAKLFIVNNWMCKIWVLYGFMDC